MTADVVVAGGGVIGSAIAWRAAVAGLDVVVVDPECGEAASLVAAGMLAPVSESLFGEEALLRLALRRFPVFAAELEEATGRRVGLRRHRHPGQVRAAPAARRRPALDRLVRIIHQAHRRSGIA